MKKIFFAVILSLPLLFACSGRPAHSKLTFLTYFSNQHDKYVLTEITKAFEDKYNCSVEIRSLDWRDAEQKTLSELQSANPPDIIEMGAEWVAGYAADNRLLPLNADSISLSSYSTLSRQNSRWNDRYWAVPWLMDSRVLFCNMDIMTKAGLKNVPKDFPELLLYSEKCNAIPGKFGFGASTFDPHRLYKKILPIIWSFGSDIVKNNSASLNNANCLEALQYYIKLTQNGTIETQRQIDAMFSKGQIAFCVSGSWLISKIEEENTKLKYTVNLVPRLSYAGCQYLGINKNTKNTSLAAKYIKFLTSGKHASLLFRKLPYVGIPASDELLSDYKSSADEKMKIVIAQLQKSRMPLAFKNWPDLEKLFEDALGNAIIGEKTPEQALNDAQYTLIARGKSKF